MTNQVLSFHEYFLLCLVASSCLWEKAINVCTFDKHVLFLRLSSRMLLQIMLTSVAHLTTESTGGFHWVIADQLNPMFSLLPTAGWLFNSAGFSTFGVEGLSDAPKGRCDWMTVISAWWVCVRCNLGSLKCSNSSWTPVYGTNQVRDKSIQFKMQDFLATTGQFETLWLGNVSSSHSDVYVRVPLEGKNRGRVDWQQNKGGGRLCAIEITKQTIY